MLLKRKHRSPAQRRGLAPGLSHEARAERGAEYRREQPDRFASFNSLRAGAQLPPRLPLAKLGAAHSWQTIYPACAAGTTASSAVKGN